MRYFQPAALALLASSAFASASTSFAGSSLYFLAGLSASDQAYYIDTLASYGAKVIRIWINGLDVGCVKGSYVLNSISEFETTVGEYNWDTLAALDAVLAQMVVNGMKAIISVHDGNDIHDSSVSGNGCDVYCETYGTSFYSNTQAQAYYDARVKAILTYVSPSSGIAWGAWSAAILALISKMNRFSSPTTEQMMILQIGFADGPRISRTTLPILTSRSPLEALVETGVIDIICFLQPFNALALI
jgi:hypothetical protein